MIVSKNSHFFWDSYDLKSTQQTQAMCPEEFGVLQRIWSLNPKFRLTNCLLLPTHVISSYRPRKYKSIILERDK